MAIDHPAVETFQAFLAAMKEWGQEMIDHYRSLDWGNVDEGDLARSQAEQRNKIETIFGIFCEAGLNAKRLQDKGLAFDGDSPEYDPDFQPIVAIKESPGRVVIETKETNKLGWRYRYELVVVGDEWRIRDNKKRGSDKDSKWRTDLL